MFFVNGLALETGMPKMDLPSIQWRASKAGPAATNSGSLRYGASRCSAVATAGLWAWAFPPTAAYIKPKARMRNTFIVVSSVPRAGSFASAFSRAGRLAMLLQPRARNFLAGSKPNVGELLGVIDKAAQSAYPPRPADDSRVQPDRHHARIARRLGI